MDEVAISMSEGISELDLIATEWSQVHDSKHFMARYAPAVRRYLEALLKNSQDAEDVAQSFFLRVVEGGFDRANPERGRFRDYLKIGVRNAAVSFLRQKQRQPRAIDAAAIQQMFSRAEVDASREWLREWQNCLLDRAWKALDWHQQCAGGNLFHTVLRMAVDHPDEDSAALAGRVATLAGRPLRCEAFRKQLSRARRKFAELLVSEVKQTLKNPTAADIDEELTELGLRDYVRTYVDHFNIGDEITHS